MILDKEGLRELTKGLKVAIGICSSLEIFCFIDLNISQGWVDFAFSCKYITIEEQTDFNISYDNIIGKLVNMSLNPENWSW